TYAIALVDPSDPDATNILIDTQSGIKALRKIFLCPSNITYEGQNYPIVTIGNQCWFANNLNVGIMIAGTSGQGNNGIIEKYCYNNTTANCDTYGGLYQWNEAMQYTTTEKAQGICPAGWHIPSDAEIYTLENYLATGACSATRTGWGCNPAGQAFLNTPPAGRRMIAGNFGSINLHLNLWSSTGNVASAWRRYLYIGQSTIYRNTYGTGYGFTVRCLKD
ncbi:hypothetical protein KKA24_01805, partial [Patescibacteria group bacterium]|nr:hypothetical protein [Patescibacteria group bacterium]